MSDIEKLLSDLHTLHPKLIDLSLGRVIRLLASLDNPHKKLPPVVHVAGTNGKGSTIALMQSILEAAGKRVHVFTSPHLIKFNERIKLGHPQGAKTISDGQLVDVLSRARNANSGEPITFFEITTAAAFLAFSENPADVLLLETGLGGRLDATNVIEKPAVTVITPLSMDHTGFLGETIGEIAAEKAGIMKAGVPCISSRQEDAAFEILEKQAKELDITLTAAGRGGWDCYEQHGRMVYQGENELLDLPLPNLAGYHQIENAGLAITAVMQLYSLDTSHADTIACGVKNAHWPARLENLTEGRLHETAGLKGRGVEIWLDGGHNPAAAKNIARFVCELEERLPKQLYLVCAMMDNKDAAAFFQNFSGLADMAVTVPLPNSTRGYDPVSLAEIAKRQGMQAVATRSLSEAIKLCGGFSHEPPRIMICGSLYLVGHALDANR
jgi:dihydrofolate synthase/folylpolyglutamate synthase